MLLGATTTISAGVSRQRAPLRWANVRRGAGGWSNVASCMRRGRIAVLTRSCSDENTSYPLVKTTSPVNVEGQSVPLKSASIRVVGRRRRSRTCPDDREER